MSNATSGTPGPVDRGIIDDSARTKWLTGCLVCLTVVCALAAGCAVLVYIEHKARLARSQTYEARIQLDNLLYSSARYFDQHERFPDSQSLTPAERIGNVRRVTDDWSSPTWQALEFELNYPHHYRYQYDATNHPTDPNQSSFTASAFGDLDDDGVLSTFVILGNVSGMQVGEVGDLRVENELE